MFTVPNALRTLSEALFSPELSLRLTSAREGRSWSFHWQQPLMTVYLRQRGKQSELHGTFVEERNSASGLIVWSGSCIGYLQCVWTVWRFFQTFPSLMKLKKLSNWDFCKWSFTWSERSECSECGWGIWGKPSIKVLLHHKYIMVHFHAVCLWVRQQDGKVCF